MRPFITALFTFAAVSCALLASCAKPEPPTLSPRAIRVATVGRTGIGLVLDLDVHNPNAFPLIARRVDGTLALGPSSGAELGRGHAELASSIPANGASSVAANLQIDWTNLAALFPFAVSKQPVPYTFRGNAMVGGERLNVTVPFEIAGQLTAAQLLDAGLRPFATPAPAPR